MPSFLLTVSSQIIVLVSTYRNVHSSSVKEVPLLTPLTGDET